MATAEAISFCGASPVFVDIDEHTYTIDPSRIERAITAKTKAILPVHLFGQPADMEPTLAIGRATGIPIIEDAAQAHGAEYKGRKAGSLGLAGCFSFYPGKNLGALGEAGAVVTNDDHVAEKIRILRDHGQTRKYHHSMVGWNCRMDGIQAAALSIKLPHLDRNNALRRSHAVHYNREFEGIEGITAPLSRENVTHVYHVYAVRAADRDLVIARLNQAGIGCGIHYPVPVHLQEAYRHLGYVRGSFPVSEKTSDEFISLPMYPELNFDQRQTVISAVQEAVFSEALN
jgi:dTDP-4-amino-4,6-dideoxygalactose transaminase